MSKMETEVLLKKGKRAAAAYIQAECAMSARPENLNALLDNLLDPLKSIDEWETIEWCRWLMAGGCNVLLTNSLPQCEDMTMQQHVA